MVKNPENCPEINELLDTICISLKNIKKDAALRKVLMWFQNHIQEIHHNYKNANQLSVHIDKLLGTDNLNSRTQDQLKAIKQRCIDAIQSTIVFVKNISPDILSSQNKLAEYNLVNSKSVIRVLITPKALWVDPSRGLLLDWSSVL